MKWKNKGHEFDELYEKICGKDSFYLFGAGDYGNQFFNIFQSEIKIEGYIDNDPRKQKTRINSLPCISLNRLYHSKEVGIIVTMSQIARVKAIQQLEEKGFRQNSDYFIIEEFLSVYYAYRHDMVYFSSISFLPSTRCNLNCRHCLNFNPFAKEFYVRKYDDLIKDIDLFFSCVDRLMLFHVSGGEPFLYMQIADVLVYIDSNYGSKIDTLRTVTNGTVVPEDKTLEKLSNCRFELTVDDYRESVPKYRDNFQKLIEKLEKHGIKYYINTVDSWIDLAPERTDNSGLSEDVMIHYRNSCSQSWQELRDGKLYNCNYAAYATVAGIAGEEDSEETYDLISFSPDKKKELVEFRLGYTEKGYTNFCRKCRGFKQTNNEIVKPAVQEERFKN